jgi:putative ABC transport system substrate-binding protein
VHSADEAKSAIGAEIDTRLDAIVTVFGPSTQAASAATTQIPIVFCPVADPVASKYAASNEAPGGNLTGVASTDAEASRRRLAAFRQSPLAFPSSTPCSS